MLARRWQLQNMQNRPFIYLLLNDPPGGSQEGIFLCRFRGKKQWGEGSFFL